MTEIVGMPNKTSHELKTITMVSKKIHSAICSLEKQMERIADSLEVLAKDQKEVKSPSQRLSEWCDKNQCE